MSGDDHFSRAEEILGEVDTAGLPPTLMIKVAEVHATLAVAQAMRDQEAARLARTRRARLGQGWW
jgi:hypothetical protein